ncbi:MAG: VOC family protein [Deltaproteobacteria bacterium]|nr:VOC family protein [Deltaproteobacteria bacterium]
MRLGYTILYVDDVSRALGFYERAFGLTRVPSRQRDYGEPATGSTALAFSSRALMESLGKHPAAADPARPVCEIALVTDDVAAALDRAVAAGASLVQPANVMPWGQTVGYVSDLDGFLVEICTPMG